MLNVVSPLLLLLLLPTVLLAKLMLTLGATDLEYLVLMTVLLLLPTVLLAMSMLTLGATDLEYLVLMTVGPVLEEE